MTLHQVYHLTNLEICRVFGEPIYSTVRQLDDGLCTYCTLESQGSTQQYSYCELGHFHRTEQNRTQRSGSECQALYM
jgi:hypothetical protein